MCLLATVAVAGAAWAVPCPTVMIVLDVSGSMGDTPSGGTPDAQNPSKMDIAKQALTTLINNYGARIPFGFTTFNEVGLDCTQGISILVEPKHGTASQILQAVMMQMPGGGTNTAEAIDAVAADPAMHDPTRPSSYIMLITDGEPNCDSNDPQQTISRIQAAASATMPIKTYVIGFGALPTTDQMTMDMMADAGGVPCTGTGCNGHHFYAADSAQALNDAINAISEQISGEFGAQCDDSCYANPCPNAGQICVNGMCQNDPCANVASTCAPGDYCYTNGTSPGMCVPACTQQCPAGQVCSSQGTCQPDPCAGVTCPSGQVCRQGQCATDACGTAGCPLSGQICYQGQCIDDPCRYVQCPSGTQCIMGTGACGISSGGNGTTGRGGRGTSGCDVETGAASGGSLAAFLFLFGALFLSRRRRRV